MYASFSETEEFQYYLIILLLMSLLDISIKYYCIWIGIYGNEMQSHTSFLNLFTELSIV